MARKRNNTAGGAKKPAKPKRASRSASVSATPASVSPVSVSPAPGSSTVGESHPTVAEQSVGAETIAEEQVVVEESVAEQTTVEESVVEEQKVEESIAEETVKETIEESIVEETVLEKKIVEQTIPEESIIEQSTSEESSIKKSAINASSATESATEKPAASESSSEQSPAAYSLDISPEHDFCRETTEDQLDLIIESQHPPAPTHAPLSDDLSPARPLFSSVNMEDSQAELLASNLADSTYHSSLASSADEFHVLEAPSAEIHPAEEEELLEDEQHGFDQHDARSYVVTPGAYASTGPQDTEEIDVQDAVAAVDTVVDAVAAAGARADDAVPQLNIQENAVTEQENRTDAEPKTHTDAEPQTNTNTAAEPECTANPDQDLRQEHDIDGDHAQNTPPNDSVVLLSESYVHVEHESSRDVIESVDSMTNREQSEQVERAVSEVMDNAKETAKDVGNKAADAAHDAGKKVNDAANDASKKADQAASDAGKKAQEAGDAAADAAHDAGKKARDIVDNASKTVRDAASNVNEKAHDAISRARESGEKFAKKAREEAEDAEKALKKQAKETPNTTLRALGIVAAALAVASGYYFRLPGRDNQRLGFSVGVASAVVGLGTLATAFIKRNA